MAWAQVKRSKALQRRCQSRQSLVFSLRAATVPDGFSCWGRRDQAQGLIDEGPQTWSDYLLSSASLPSLRLNCLVEEIPFRWFSTAGCFSPGSALRSLVRVGSPGQRGCPAVLLAVRIFSQLLLLLFLAQLKNHLFVVLKTAFLQCSPVTELVLVRGFCDSVPVFEVFVVPQ